MKATKRGNSRRRLLYLAALSMLVMLVAAPAALAQQDLDCADLSTQADAQAFFLAQGGPAADPNRLDADNDGIACEESLPLGPAVPLPVVTPDQTVVTPDKGVQETLPETGGTSLLLPAAGLLLVAGLIGLRLVRRS